MKRVIQLNPRQLISASVVLVVLAIFTWIGYLRYVKGQPWPEGTGFEGKTLWDLLELLIVPAVLAIGALLFNQQERRSEHKIAEDRNQEAALQNYLDKMTELLLKHNLRDTKGIVGRKNITDIQDAARVRTVTILRQLNANRRNIVFQFLRDTELSEFILISASLGETNLESSELLRMNLSQSILNKANLRGADLRKADLRVAQLSEANLERANLIGAILFGAFLGRANLDGANLSNSYLNGAILSKATLGRAQLAWANLERAALAGANLVEANLTGAYLGGADLTGADLRRAILSGAYLGQADLSGATIDDKQLAAAKSLEGAILPNRKIFNPAMDIEIE